MSVRQLSSPSQASGYSVDYGGDGNTTLANHTGGRTQRTKTDPLWRKHDAKANKSGQRGTIYWVGKSIMGEDGALKDERTNGAKYHGEWGNNKKHGYGVQVFPSGEKYEGQWGNGLRDGEGTFWAPVGKAKKLRKVYVGGWKDDRRHGRGTCFFKNGEFFQGSWDQNKMHGQGTLRYENGDLYVGEWHDGQRSGKGTLNKANGDCYEGYWLADKREGSGSFFYSDSGKVFVGEWANDLPKSGIYTQASPNPEQAGGVPTTSVLPSLRLAMPTEVLEGALAVVRNGRKAFRANNTPVTRLFSDEELSSLQEAFAAAQRGDGLAGFVELQALCSQLGSDLEADHLQELLVTSGLAEQDSDLDAVGLAFEDFLRLIAVLLDEEASHESGDFNGDDYNWDDSNM